MNKSARSNILPMQTEQDKNQSPLPSAALKPRRKLKWKGRKIFLYGVMAWAAYVFLFVQTPNLHRLEQDQAKLQADIEAAKQSNKDLQKQINSLNDPNYIAEIARKKYMMVKDGETLFVEPKQ